MKNDCCWQAGSADGNELQAMTNSERATQIRVGIFLILGLALVGAMVVYFGRFGDGLQKFYNLRVEYPNASGLFRGADVLLAGAKVGAVESGPFVLDSMRGVYVELKIREGVEIPEGSTFTVGSSGLLGDSFVDITMPSDLDVSDFTPIPPGAIVEGGKQGGLGELAEEGGRLLEDVRTAVNNINTVVTRLNSEVLTGQSVESISTTLKNVETTSSDFAKASRELDKMMKEAAAAMNELTAAVGGVNQTVDQSESTLVSIEKAADEFRKTMLEAQKVLKLAQSGKGPLGTLLNDRTMAENLQALVLNLRRHGILWYRDRAGAAEE